MLPTERKKTAAFFAKATRASAEDLSQFLNIAQWIDDSETSKNRYSLESFLKKLSNISAEDQANLEYDLKKLARLLYRRALISQTVRNGWFLTKNCKAIFKALGVNNTQLNTAQAMAR